VGVETTGKMLVRKVGELSAGDSLPPFSPTFHFLGEKNEMVSGIRK